MKESEVLLQAASLIEPTGCWTQGQSARNYEGYNVFVEDKNACCFCMSGAIARICKIWCGEDLVMDPVYDKSMAELAEDLKPYLKPDLLLSVVESKHVKWSIWKIVTGFNDDLSRKQEEVVAALRFTGERLKALGR
jgi:hypothetical protein